MAELTAQSTSIQSLYGWFRDNRLLVNRRYQRKLVWTLEEKQKLIDSILQRFPVPAVLIAEREPGSYEIIDGLQRLHAIVSFVELSFPTADQRYFDLEFFPTAKKYADLGEFPVAEAQPRLTQGEVTALLDYSLALSVMRNATESDIDEVFDRINTYGHRLSDQERRQAGVQSEFSTMVREVACQMRGDVSAPLLPLSDMPSISVDLPMTKHGYAVRADDVFWVQQGILRSTDLRDSMDEQCIADIAACVVKGQMIDRSKNALDKLYNPDTDEAASVQEALAVYGSDRFGQEFKYCIEEIVRTCAAGQTSKLRDVIFRKRTTNPFPSLFALLYVAFHELIVQEKQRPSDYDGIRRALVGLSGRLDTSRAATMPDERRRNVDTIKGLVSPHFIAEDVGPRMYQEHAAIDVDNIIRLSEIELPHYELKQGLLRLSDDRAEDPEIMGKVAATVCAIANNGPGRSGKVLIGVTDTEADAKRIEALDGVITRRVGKRFVAGVAREARKLNLSPESYYGRWKTGLRASGLSPHLLDAVMSNIGYNNYYGLGVIIISVPPQQELSYVGDKIYWRDGDETKEAESNKRVADLAKRF